MSARAQRLRVTYARGPQVRFVAHLDMMRFWERALRRAQIRVSYSEGFSPHAQIQLGAPLSVGMTGRAEVLDVVVAETLTPDEFQRTLQAQLPPGVEIRSVDEVALSDPAIQAQLRAADFELRLRPDVDLDAVRNRVNLFLAAESFPWEHAREKSIKRYDFRPLVLMLRLEGDDESTRLVARLKAEETGTGRADQLAAALGVADDVIGIERIGLVLAAPAVVDG